MDWVLKFQEKIRIVKYVSAIIYGVWLYQRTHTGLPRQKNKPESKDVCKRQLNQASWNETILKFGSQNQWDLH